MTPSCHFEGVQRLRNPPYVHPSFRRNEATEKSTIRPSVIPKERSDCPDIIEDPRFAGRNPSYIHQISPSGRNDSLLSFRRSKATEKSIFHSLDFSPFAPLRVEMTPSCHFEGVQRLSRHSPPVSQESSWNGRGSSLRRKKSTLHSLDF